ncbi:hypothetical protein Tco_0556233 [Tanacetum coccineum]
MLVENKYPLTKEVLSQLLNLKLETEEESTMALELIKFVKQQLEEFEDSDDHDLANGLWVAKKFLKNYGSKDQKERIGRIAAQE